MKKPALFALMLLLTAFSRLAFAQAEDPQVRKEIQRHYAKWDKLVAEGDFKSLFAMLDPSFVGMDKNGRAANCAAAKKQIESMFKNVREPKSKIVVKQIQSQGSEVVAWVSMTASFKMKQGSSWKPMSFTSNFAETLKKIDGQWRFTASQELP
jgi:ketosteroid isomerase-like protein